MADLQHSLVLAAPYIDRYGYTGVFGAILLESLGVPMPGEALLIAIAVLATKGTLHLVPLLAWAWVAAVLGDNIGYGIGRFGGRRLILRYGQPIGITETRLAKIEAFFHRWGGEVVLVARFFAGLRQLNGLVAGTAGMRWWRFLAYNSAGAALWVSAWGVGVYVFGQHIGQLMPWVHRVGYVLLIAGAAVLLLVLLGSCLHHGWAKCTTGKDHTHQERTAHRAHRRVPPGASGA
jgi:membrane protein DedA with SNARE-associated domain